MLKYSTGKTLSKIHKLCENIEFIAEYFCCRCFRYTSVCFSLFFLCNIICFIFFATLVNNGGRKELKIFAEPHKSICNCAHCENANENVFITIVLMRFLFIYHNNQAGNN